LFVVKKLYKVDAIVLRSLNLRGADQLLTLYSRSRGKIKAVAYGVRKPASRKRGAVQPFCYSHFLLYKGRDLDSVSQCEGREMFLHLREDLSKLAYAGYLCELVDGFTVEGDSNERLFLLLLTSLYMLVEGDSEIVTRVFELKLMEVLGYGPLLTSCACCRRGVEDQDIFFSAKMGGIICSHCFDEDRSSLRCNKGLLKVLQLFAQWDLVKLRRLKIDKNLRKQLKETLHYYITYYIERKIKSQRFLESFIENHR